MKHEKKKVSKGKKEVLAPVVIPPIAALTASFQSEEMNLVVAKINEIIDRLNK